jgi:hypothetical protein
LCLKVFEKPANVIKFVFKVCFIFVYPSEKCLFFFFGLTAFFWSVVLRCPDAVGFFPVTAFQFGRVFLVRCFTLSGRRGLFFPPGRSRHAVKALPVSSSCPYPFFVLP